MVGEITYFVKYKLIPLALGPPRVISTGCRGTFGALMYRQIDCRLWMDPKVRKMDASTQRLFFYLMTNMHTHLCGMYYLPMAFMAHELCEDDIDTPMGKLIELGRVKYDEENEVVWVVNMFKFQGLSKKGTASDKTKAAVKSQMDTLSIPYLESEFYGKYPIDTLSIPYRYPIDTLSDPGLQEQEQKQKQEQEQKQCHDPISLSQSQDDDQSIHSRGHVAQPSSWLPGEKKPTGAEQTAIVELQHLWAERWHKDPPTMAPRGDDLDRIVEALRAGTGNVDGESIAMAKRAVMGHHKRASKDGSQMGRDFSFAFPKLSRGNRIQGGRLDWIKYESFALEIKERKPPPPKPPPEQIEPGATPEEIAQHMADIKRKLAEP